MIRDFSKYSLRGHKRLLENFAHPPLMGIHFYSNLANLVTKNCNLLNKGIVTEWNFFQNPSFSYVTDQQLRHSQRGDTYKAHYKQALPNLKDANLYALNLFALMT